MQMLFSQRAAKIIMGFSKVRLQADGAFKSGNSLIGAIEPKQYGPAIEMSMDRFRVQGHSPVQADQGLLIFTKLHERDAEIELISWVTRIKGDGAAHMPRTFFKPPRLGKRET